MRARSLARRLAFVLGLPLFAAGGGACKKADEKGERPNRAPAPAAASADHEALCQRGTFCVARPAGPIEVAATSPFESCSVITPLPSGVPAGMEPTRRSKLRIWFHVDTTGEARKRDPETCCYEWREHCAGRPLRNGSRALVARPVARSAGAFATDWVEAPSEIATSLAGRGVNDHGRAPSFTRARQFDARDDDEEDRGDERAATPGLSALAAPSSPEARAEAAAHWLDNALLEHASIAAFARVALDLLALGAPAFLVAGAHGAALDEVRHARLSFSIATALGAAVSGPGPLPEVAHVNRPSAPDVVLRETFHDGCIGEAAAALVLAAAARRAARPLSETLSRMAEDEARHAELAWRTVHWLTTTFPSAAAALREELAALRAAPSHAIESRRGRASAAARHGAWCRADMRDARRRATRDIALPLAAALLPSPSGRGVEG